MALSPEELALIQELKAKGMSLDQVKIEIGKRRADVQYIARPEVKPTTGFVSDTMTDIGQTVAGITRELAGGVQRGATGFAGEERVAPGLAVAGGNVLGGMSRAFGEAVVGIGKTLLPESSEQAIKSSFERTVAPIAELPWVQQAVQDYKWLEENDPVQFRRTQAAIGALEAVFDVAGLRVATPVFGSVKKGMRETTDQLIEQTTRATTRGVTPPGAVTETARTAVGGAEAVATDVKEYAQFAAQHLQQSMAEAQARRTAINEAASPQIQSAMKVNVPTDQINLITTADNATTKAMQDMLYAYEGANQEAVAKLFSQSGEEMMKTVDNRMKAIGEELGNAIDNLPNATIDMRPAQQQVLKMLEDNGIIITKEPSGRIRYQWDTGGPSAYTPEQQAYIQQAVDTMLKFDQLNSRGVYNGDRFFGNLINQFYADKNMRGLFVNINGVDKAFLPMMRELYRSPLDNITQGGISALNKQYSQYRRLVDAANETLYNAGKDLGIPIDIGAPLQTNLRRIFSNAKSRSQFSAVLNELDRVARENGYVGPDLKSMSKFDLYVQSLYPDEAIPRGSFAGQIRAGMGGGLLSKVERFLSSGEPNINDQRNALKGLLNADIPRTPDVPPSTTAVPPTKAPSPTKGSQTSASPNDTTPNLINEKEQATKVAREIVGKSTATKGRVADIVLGPPASGKNAVFSDRLLTERNALLLDADEVKKMLPGYDGGKGAAATHEASSNILEKTLIQEAAIKGDNIVLPMVGKTQAKIENLITLLKGRGYTVNLHLAEIPVETSVARAQARAAKTGRVVPEDYLRSIGDKPTQTFDGIVNNPKMKAMLNEYNKYSNDVPMGTSPKVLDTSSPSFVFVSPSTEVGLTYDQAKQALKTPLQKQSHEMMQDIINQRKIPGNIEDAIGKWSDGAENTLVFKDGNLTREQLRLLGAEGAMPMRQKQYIWFKHNPKGADYVQELAVSGKVTVEQLKDALTKNGVQFMTVGKDRVYIFNKAGDYFDAELPKKISTTYKELGLDRGGRKGYRGDGEFEGSWAEGEGARDEAQGIYKQIIDNGGK